MSVTLQEVLAAASERLAPLTGECAGYVVLAAADQLLHGPRRIGAGDVRIEESGAVNIVGGPATDVASAEHSLRQLLDTLILAACSASAGLMRIGRRPVHGDIAKLIQELEVGLIPANRAAARRSLARLHRETQRALDVLGERAFHAAVDAGAQEPGGAPALAAAASLGSAPNGELRAEAPAQETRLDQAWRTHPNGLRFAEGPGPRLVTGELPEVHELVEEPAIALELDLAEPSIDVEFSPLPPKPELAAFAPVPAPECPLGSEPEHLVRLEAETPAEPVIRRRGSEPPSYVPEIPDIHKTPYLGTVVRPVSEMLAQREWPASLGRAQHVARPLAPAEFLSGFDVVPGVDVTSVPAVLDTVVDPCDAEAESLDLTEIKALEVSFLDHPSPSHDTLEAAAAGFHALTTETETEPETEPETETETETEDLAHEAQHAANVAVAPEAVVLASEVLEVEGLEARANAEAAPEIRAENLETLSDEALENEVLENEVLENEVLENEVLENEVLENELLEEEALELEATTDPMPPVEEWLDSDELEDLEPIALWPRVEAQPLGPVEPAPARFAAPESSVRDLIDRFRVAEAPAHTELMSDLKRLAGVSATPPPVKVIPVPVVPVLAAHEPRYSTSPLAGSTLDAPLRAVGESRGS